MRYWGTLIGRGKRPVERGGTDASGMRVVAASFAGAIRVELTPLDWRGTPLDWYTVTEHDWTKAGLGRARRSLASGFVGKPEGMSKVARISAELLQLAACPETLAEMRAELAWVWGMQPGTEEWGRYVVGQRTDGGREKYGVSN